MEYVSYTDGKIPSVKLLNLVVFAHFFLPTENGAETLSALPKSCSPMYHFLPHAQVLTIFILIGLL
jgi:hypothetical protein